MKMTTRSIVAIMTSLAIAAAVVVGLMLPRPPSETRPLRTDQHRLTRLQSITYHPHRFWNRGKRLPSSLLELSQNRFSSAITRDPESGAEYEYNRVSETTYELCAVFSLPSLSENDPRRVNYGVPATFWQHGAGRSCFSLD